MSDSNQLGALLVARGLLTREQLDAALLEHERTRKSLGRVLIEEGIVAEPDLVATLAAQIGLEYIDLDEYPIDAAAAGMIPSALARCRSAGTTTASSSRWPTRRTCSRSTTSARSPAPRSAPSSRRGRASATRSTAITGSMPMSRAHPRWRPASSRPRTTSHRCARSPRTRRSSSWSTCSSPRPCRTGPATSTSSPASATCGFATASTVCCTR